MQLEDETSSRNGDDSDISPRRRTRVLVIDDEPAIRAAISAALARRADVVGAANATEAQQLLQREHDFQLVLCDLDLGTSSGEDVYSAIEETRPLLAERFVFMTGWVDPFTSFLERTRKRCLIKPFGLWEILDLFDGGETLAEP